MAVPSVSTGIGSRRVRARIGPPSSRILPARSSTRSTSTISADRRRSGMGHGPWAMGNGAWRSRADLHKHTHTQKERKKKIRGNTASKKPRNKPTNELAKATTMRSRKLRLQQDTPNTPKRIQSIHTFGFASFWTDSQHAGVHIYVCMYVCMPSNITSLPSSSL